MLAAFALLSSARAEVKLLTPSGYIPGVPFLARVEVRNGSGARDWDKWDGEATLSSDNAGVTLSTNKVTLRNGLGTALITINGNANFNLTAQVGAEQAQRAVANRSAQPATTVSGTLPGTTTTWSGVVRVTGTVTVPTGHTLTINPDTLVLVNGVSSGTAGINFMVNGAIRSLGTETQPVVITCADATQNWGQIRHETSQASLYQHTLISRAGRTVGEGHTATGPAFRVTNSTVDFESTVISDLHAAGVNIGKIMMTTGSTLTFNNCVLARARMGPEIASTGLTLTNSYIMQMTGPDDADGFYLHDSGGRSLLIKHCVVAGGDDDGVDTLDAHVTIEDCIIRDWPNPNEDAKGVSGFHGEVILRRNLIVNTFAGVSTKSSGPLAVLRLDHCTIRGVDRGIAAATKSTANAGNINIYMTNCIVTAADSIVSDFTPDKFVSVTYCAFGENWPGIGNLNVDPMFVSPATGDFHLQPGSPCINAGDPDFPADSDGSRTEMGFYPAENIGDFFYVTLTSPAPGGTFVAPTNLLLSATASSSTGTVSRVQFFEGATKIGEATSAPYNFTWTNVAVGNHTLQAIATQIGGSTATSGPVSFSVRATQGSTTNLAIAPGAAWKYLDDGSNQGTAWYSPTFDESSWKTGLAQFGYGDNDEITPIGFGPSTTDKYVTTYFRKTFVIEDVSRVERVSLELLRDDGAAIYLNNREAYRVDLGTNSPITYRQYADRAVDYPWLTNSIDKSFLVTGTNTIAVEMHQGSAGSGDVSFDLALAVVIAAPTNGSPIVSIDSPAENTIYGAPGNIAVAASAFDFDGSVANVALYANGAKIQDDASAPYNLAWNNVAAGNYTLTVVATDNFGASATSGPVHITVSSDVAAPAVISQSPAPGSVSNLREITVTLSKAVGGVNASDLLINGTPASAVTGSGATYTFSFATPPPGALTVSWAANHGIADTFIPPNAFNAAAATSTWQYQETDTIAPTIFQATPAARDLVSSLNQISVTFSEPVTGVNASDLVINSLPATA
ncbi:MAG TPA: Ig-like domain-containing protein, partial [Verrucomicrobiae bacterium]|nr:Ig-like domain-containing protein [Verrucomicrobiae bacterium]